MANSEYQNALRAVKRAIDVEQNVIIWGDPGIGKSENVQAMAEEQDMGIIELRLAQMESVDFRGSIAVFTDPDTADDLHPNGYSYTRFNPPDEMPRVPRDKQRGILFMDEINLSQAADDVRAAAFQLLDQKRIGSYYLPKGWTVVAAANPVEMNSLAVELPMPLNNRFAHINLPHPPVQDWIDWAASHNIDHRILAFHGSAVAANLLYKFEDGATAFPTPRSWAMVSRLIKGVDDYGFVLDLAQSCIGEAAAAHFRAYLKYYEEIPTLDDIINNPTGAKIPGDRGGVWAVLASLTNINIGESSKEQESISDSLFSYIKRFDHEPEIVLSSIRMLYQHWGSTLPAGVMVSFMKPQNRWISEKFMPWIKESVGR